MLLEPVAVDIFVRVLPLYAFFYNCIYAFAV